MVRLWTGTDSIYHTNLKKYLRRKQERNRWRSRFKITPVKQSPHIQHLARSRRATKYVRLAGFGKDRYCIINKAGNVVDDAGGHGFKSKKKAMKSGVWHKYKHLEGDQV